MKISELKTINEIAQEKRESDPEYRAEWDRTAFAREVAIAIVRYRTERGMSQRDLATATGLTQPAIARLETGDHAPSLATLVKLTRSTGLRFRFDISGGSAQVVAA